MLTPFLIVRRTRTNSGNWEVLFHISSVRLANALPTSYIYIRFLQPLQHLHKQRQLVDRLPEDLILKLG